MILKRLLFILLVCLNGKYFSQCPSFYNYLGTLTTSPVYISCSGSSYNVNLQSNTSFGSYTVSWGDGIPNTTGSSYSANALIPHTYASTTNSYVLTISIPSSACTLTDPVIVENPVAASIQIPVSGVTQACAP